MADAVAEHVMSCAMHSKNTIYPSDFNYWLKANPTILLWLEGLTAPWMVTPTQLKKEGGTPASQPKVVNLEARKQLGDAYFGLIPAQGRQDTLAVELRHIARWLDTWDDMESEFNSIVERGKAKEKSHGADAIMMALVGSLQSGKAEKAKISLDDFSAAVVAVPRRAPLPQQQKEAVKETCKAFYDQVADQVESDRMLQQAGGENTADGMIRLEQFGQLVGTLRRVTKQPMLVKDIKAGRAKFGPYDNWWCRCFLSRAATVRVERRPHSSFDHITLARVEQVFMRHCVDRTVFSTAGFTAVVHDELGLTNRLLIRALHTTFDYNRDGNLDAEEVATSFALLARGSSTERLSLMFRIFDAGHDGLLGRDELAGLLRAFANVGRTVVQGLVEIFSEVCGQIRSPEGETNLMKEYRIKMAEASSARLDVVTAGMVQDLLNERGAGGAVDFDGFDAWARSNRSFSAWLDQLGCSWLQVLAPLEDRERTPARQQLLDSTYRARRKFGPRLEGTPLGSLTIGSCRAGLARYSTGGQLGPEQFSACLRGLRLQSPLTARRLFILFDREAVGTVATAELGSALYLLSDAEPRARLSAAWALFDRPAAGRAELGSYRDPNLRGGAEEEVRTVLRPKGWLWRVEVASLFETFYLMAMDTIAAGLGPLHRALASDPAAATGGGPAGQELSHMVLRLSHTRVREYITKLLWQLDQFASRKRLLS